jgi:hypothetical protein
MRPRHRLDPLLQAERPHPAGFVHQYALDNPAFQQGTTYTQFVAAADLIIRF